MTDQNTDDGPWVIVVGTVDPVDTTAIHLDRFEMDGAPFIPVFGNPEVFRERMIGTPSANRALKIKLELLQGILKGDERLIFDTGQGDPIPMSVADLRGIATRQ